MISSLAKCVVLVSSIIAVGQACIATTTTTPVCCSVLSTSTLTRVPPVGITSEQCSVLRRISSVCPTTGTVLCDAAADTNPSNVIIQLIGTAGTSVKEVSVAGDSAATTLQCVNGLWYVPGTSTQVKSVTCSQTGSTGTDEGNFP
ncbi:unnamed protein product [Caenorhabditis angaria]|uniref:C6 domain-containing protein n=1 Tax=Caenorhabditis angaria TaxID=860376 RepID=A0A9P1IAT0_9PELO|nr:unnamed protein product [Caenorhabditis angaria]